MGGFYTENFEYCESDVLKTSNSKLTSGDEVYFVSGAFEDQWAVVGYFEAENDGEG